MPTSQSGSPTTSGSAEKYIRESVFRLNSVCGATVAITASSTASAPYPLSVIRWLSQTKYSSDVRRVSVAMRHSDSSVSPS